MDLVSQMSILKRLFLLICIIHGDAIFSSYTPISDCCNRWIDGCFADPEFNDICIECCCGCIGCCQDICSAMRTAKKYGVMSVHIARLCCIQVNMTTRVDFSDVRINNKYS